MEGPLAFLKPMATVLSLVFLIIGLFTWQMSRVAAASAAASAAEAAASFLDRADWDCRPEGPVWERAEAEAGRVAADRMRGVGGAVVGLTVGAERCFVIAGVEGAARRAGWLSLGSRGVSCAATVGVDEAAFRPC